MTGVECTADSDSPGEYLPSESNTNGDSSESANEVNLNAAQLSRGVRRGRGRGIRGRNVCTQPRSTDGWAWVTTPEEYEGWIKHFNEPVGYAGELDLTNADPVNFLSLFLGDDFWELVTEETNRYARQMLSSAELKPKSRFHKWCSITILEMKAFFALHLSMALVEKHEIEDYWSTFWITATPGFASVMSRNRFEMILSFLHFANNDNYVRRGGPGHDKLFKIRRVIDMIIPRFASLWKPHKELALDEMTIAFKGRSTLKMYNPKKPDKYGYRVYALSESCSGYVLRWSLHTGKLPDETRDISATHGIVRELMAPYIGKGHEVYMDSYYTSPTIANELADADTGLCGTVSSRRKGMPSCLRPNALRLRRGDDPAFLRKGKLLACAWHDTKRVIMLSTVQGNGCVEKRIRTKASESGFRAINRPVCVDEYNKFMGGVDRADQRMKTYLFPHRSRKWYHRIVNAIVSIAVVNSHIIYRKCSRGPHKPLKVYIQAIISAFLEGQRRGVRSKRGRPSTRGDLMPDRLTGRHWLCIADGRPDCMVCSDRSQPNGRCQTKYRCQQCGVGLCAVPCNERYHTLRDYKLRKNTSD